MSEGYTVRVEQTTRKYVHGGAYLSTVGPPNHEQTETIYSQRFSSLDVKAMVRWLNEAAKKETV